MRPVLAVGLMISFMTVSMMIDFMIIGLPRSGTTWVSNWLSTSHSYCLHDPLNKVHYSKWDTDRKYFPPDNCYRHVGVACTGIWRFPKFVNNHPARKLVVIRDQSEVNESLNRINLSGLEDDASRKLALIEGPRVHYRDLFNPVVAESIFHYLTSPAETFCLLRYKQLTEFTIEPRFSVLEKNNIVMKTLHDELNNS